MFQSVQLTCLPILWIIEFYIHFILYIEIITNTTGQCQSLKNELKKLNTRYPELCKSMSMASAWLPQEKIGKDSSGILDTGKLNLQEKQPSIPLRHGFKSHDSI